MRRAGRGLKRAQAAEFTAGKKGGKACQRMLGSLLGNGRKLLG